MNSVTIATVVSPLEDHRSELVRPRQALMLRKLTARCPACGKKAWRRDPRTYHHACSQCGFSDASRPAGGLARTWDEVRVEVLNRDGWTCRLKFPGCEGYAREVDHLIPRSRGGADHPDNLRAACSPCHAARARTW